MTTQRMFDETNRQVGPVTCLGQTFADDTARRAHFSALLREKLQDPAFRAIEGFPHGSDDDIIALSDPPYYTACPNPWLADFVAEWEAQKPAEQRNAPYSREPFAADVSEGRSGLFYDAHSYHTKVPHKAIMHYLLHYTQPGDIVFDGFCGTGMTGVAAQMCGNSDIVREIGYYTRADGSIFSSPNYSDNDIPFSNIGHRHAVLNDLSPIATFIASNYNTPLVNNSRFRHDALKLLDEAEKEIGWVYQTQHDSSTIGTINHVVWSDVFICPECQAQLIFWDIAVDHAQGGVKETMFCSSCNSQVTKKSLERAWIYSNEDSHMTKKAHQVPVLVEYSVGNKRYTKKPNQSDIDLISQISNLEFKYDYPVNVLPEGFNTRQPKKSHGVNRVCDFYTKRNLFVLSYLREQAKKYPDLNSLLFFVNSYDLTHGTMMSRLIYKKGDTKYTLTGYQSGTLYISSLPVEKNIITGLRESKLSIIERSFQHVAKQQLVTTQSATHTGLANESVDYIFIDPPFGANIMYSELNYLSESWLKVLTNNSSEAIENEFQNKSLDDYSRLMTQCFREAYRILKPTRWMTVEFSNTSAAVWNGIQTALQKAGFIVANVSALDKKQGSFKAVTTNTAVKQDLVISAYKPSHEFEQRFAAQADSIDGVWEFIRNHLRYLPVVKRTTDGLAFVTERDPRILYDQVIAYYIRKGFPVPIDSPAFQLGLMQRFVERDEMYFLPDQAIEYDRIIARSGQEVQANLFVSDESSAIQWLRQTLNRKPQTFADINPEFMQQLGGWSKNEAQLDLHELLEQNFLRYNGVEAVPNKIHTYLSTNYHELRNKPDTDADLRAKAKDRWYVPDLNKTKDLEQVREKALLREFDGYVAQSGKLKVFRLEAIRAGFKRAYQKLEYHTIVTIANRMPSDIIEQDEKLTMWVENSKMRLGE